MNKMVKVDSAQVTNGGDETLSFRQPYIAAIALQGTVPILFHRWNCEAVEAKAKSAKGSRAKKSDDIESYLYRNEEGVICIPGEYVRQAIIHAAKFEQDPRSPRKSAMDLFKAAIIPLTPLAPLGAKDPDYLDSRRVTIQRQGITRTRPAMKEGWTASFDILVNLPEYVSAIFLRQVLDNAGRLIGLGDFRPTYGRFVVREWSIGGDL